MRNIISCMITSVLVLGLVGCGNNTGNTNTPIENKTAETGTEMPKIEEKELTLEEALKKSEPSVIEVGNNVAGNGYLLIKVKYTSDSKKNITNLCYRLLKVVTKHKDYANINKIGVMVIADFINADGTKTETKSFAADFDKAKIDKVNMDTFDWKNTLELGAVTYQHKTVK